MEFSIKEILTKLQKKRQIFSSEADFQLEFALAIQEVYKKKEDKIDIRLEYVPGFDQSMHIDVFIIINEKECIPIELKYKTKGIKKKNSSKYEPINDNKNIPYYLKNHGAQNINCYLYLKDIWRIEQVRENIEEYKFKEGYTIFLTNDIMYQNEAGSETGYKAFSLYNHEIPKEYKPVWGKNTAEYIKNKYGKEFGLTDGYCFKWNDNKYIDGKYYSFLDNEKQQVNKFFILVNKIKKK